MGGRLGIAELFQVNERTIRRRWLSAQIKLHKNLKETPEDWPK